MTTSITVGSDPTEPATPASDTVGRPAPGSGRPARPEACCGRRCPVRFAKLDPRTLWKNPVMFIVEIGAVFTTVIAIARRRPRSPG